MYLRQLALQQISEAQSERREFLVETLARYSLAAEKNPATKMSLNRQPLHYFSNPISGVVEAGVFVWERDGHPHAIGKIFINEKKNAWGDYISSLSSSALQMKRSGYLLWRPGAARFKTLDDCQKPSSNSNARKVQMRAIASQFLVFDLWKEDALIRDDKGTDWTLRMLAKPLLRYKSTQHRIVDGALFAFVLGTNPEAILTIEAKDDADTPYWQYRLSRLTIYELKAKRQNKLVWSVPKILADDMPIDMTSYHGWHVFRKYPFDPSEPVE